MTLDFIARRLAGDKICTLSGSLKPSVVNGREFMMASTRNVRKDSSLRECDHVTTSDHLRLILLNELTSHIHHQNYLSKEGYVSM